MPQLFFQLWNINSKIQIFFFLLNLFEWNLHSILFLSSKNIPFPFAHYFHIIYTLELYHNIIPSLYGNSTLDNLLQCFSHWNKVKFRKWLLRAYYIQSTVLQLKKKIKTYVITFKTFFVHLFNPWPIFSMPLAAMNSPCYKTTS